MRKFLTSVIVFLLIVAAIIFVVKHWVIKTAVETAVTAITGFETKLAKLQIDLPAKIWIQGLVIRNPKGFEQKVFADIPEIFIDLDFGQWLHRQRIHVRELRLDIEDINIEKNKMGVSNIALLTAVGGKPQQAKPAPVTKTAPMPFLLDRFVLTMRNARYADYSSIVPVNMNVDMKIDKQVFTGITDPKALVQLIVMKIVTVSGFGNLGINPQLLQNTLNSTMAVGQDFMKQGSAALNQAVTNLPQEASAVVGAQAQNALKDSAQQATSAFGNVAGGTLPGVERAVGGVTSDLGSAASIARKRFSGLMGKLKTQTEPTESSTSPATT